MHYVYKYVLNSKIIYIGKADRGLENRLRQHGVSGDNIPREAWNELKNSEIWYIQLPTSVMTDVVESELIRRYKPKWNVAKKDVEWCGLPFVEPEWTRYVKPPRGYRDKEEVPKYLTLPTNGAKRTYLATALEKEFVRWYLIGWMMQKDWCDDVVHEISVKQCFDKDIAHTLDSAILEAGSYEYDGKYHGFILRSEYGKDNALVMTMRLCSIHKSILNGVLEKQTKKLEMMFDFWWKNYKDKIVVNHYRQIDIASIQKMFVDTLHTRTKAIITEFQTA